jgi:uncharacterized protein (TIGR03067 family)
MMRDRSGSLRPNPQRVLRHVVQAVCFSCVLAGTILPFPAAFVPAAPAPLPRRLPHNFRPLQGRWKVVTALKGDEPDRETMVTDVEIEIRDRTMTWWVGEDEVFSERLVLHGNGTRREFETCIREHNTASVRRGIYAVDGKTLRLGWMVEAWLLESSGDALPVQFEHPPPTQRTLILSRVRR